MVSACIISYNQEQYIAQCIEGALMQELDVPYEIVISDDCSTDRTAEIIREFAQNDSRIRVIQRASNVGMHRNWLESINACQGEFVAICEGDDYWNDPLKLRKQFDAIHSSESIVGCYSNANILMHDGNLSEYAYTTDNDQTLSGSAFFRLNHNPIPTCTLMLRTEAFSGFPESYLSSPFVDWILHTVLLTKGDYVFLNEKTSTYRQHENGVWSSITKEKQLIHKLRALKVVNSIVGPEFSDSNKEAIRKQLDEMLYHYRNEKAVIKYFSTWLELIRL